MDHCQFEASKFLLLSLPHPPFFLLPVFKGFNSGLPLHPHPQECLLLILIIHLHKPKFTVCVSCDCFSFIEFSMVETLHLRFPPGPGWTPCIQRLCIYARLCVSISHFGISYLIVLHNGPSIFLVILFVF